MRLLDKLSLHRLGAGESITALCQELGIDRAEFDRRWQRTIEARVPLASGQMSAAVEARVDIQRDQWGIPHIFAKRDRDLFFGLGYAMAQDRLFQLDYLRRKGLGGKKRCQEPLFGEDKGDRSIFGEVKGDDLPPRPGE